MSRPQGGKYDFAINFALSVAQQAIFIGMTGYGLYYINKKLLDVKLCFYLLYTYIYIYCYYLLIFEYLMLFISFLSLSVKLMIYRKTREQVQQTVRN